ncbi:MAG: GNAT family N-acetyltransferase, partial [Oscillospiraceae bacterium]|nr:GNAT family N-acetyltransferase [Oscillospiraceae bacterium]
KNIEILHGRCRRQIMKFIFYNFLLCIQNFRGKHFSDQMMQFMIEAAHRNNKKALRLAVVKGNLPAERLYQKTGFQYIAEYTIHYELTGKVIFSLYEIDLTNRKEYLYGIT